MKSLSDSDRQFVLELRPAEIAEIKLSELAEEYASHKEVQVFARNLALEHGNTEQQLMGLIEDVNIAPPDNMDPEHRKIEQRLLELDGDPFDREYLRTQERDHVHIINLFRREADEGLDPELTDFARRCLPLLERHLHNVRELTASLRL